jgi:hypothetical protein
VKGKEFTNMINAITPYSIVNLGTAGVAADSVVETGKSVQNQLLGKDEKRELSVQTAAAGVANAALTYSLGVGGKSIAENIVEKGHLAGSTLKSFAKRYADNFDSFEKYVEDTGKAFEDARISVPDCNGKPVSEYLSGFEQTLEAEKENKSLNPEINPLKGMLEYFRGKDVAVKILPELKQVADKFKDTKNVAGKIGALGAVALAMALFFQVTPIPLKSALRNKKESESTKQEVTPKPVEQTPVQTQQQPYNPYINPFDPLYKYGNDFPDINDVLRCGAYGLSSNGG